MQAHKWYVLALKVPRLTASDKDFVNLAIHYRDIVAVVMTPAQIVEAQKLARDWKPK